MHRLELKQSALTMVALGVNDCDIARRLGVARTTVRDWRRPRYLAGPTATCPRCWERSLPVVFSSEDYAELLGLYLGDGHITHLARTHRIRLFLDTRYPVIIDDSAALLTRAFPRNQVGRHYRQDCAMVVLYLHHRHLACLFPQHGAGKKHERQVRLEPWQERHVEAAPWAFLRGCIRSDGCSFVNRTGKYSYLSYGFANHSAEILDLFEATSRGLGLRPCRYERAIRLNRRVDVALLLHHVGVKA